MCITPTAPPVLKFNYFKWCSHMYTNHSLQRAEERERDAAPIDLFISILSVPISRKLQKK